MVMINPATKQAPPAMKKALRDMNLPPLIWFCRRHAGYFAGSGTMAVLRLANIPASPREKKP